MITTLKMSMFVNLLSLSLFVFVGSYVTSYRKKRGLTERYRQSKVVRYVIIHVNLLPTPSEEIITTNPCKSLSPVGFLVEIS